MNFFPRYVRLSLPRLWMRDLVYFGTRSMVVGGSYTLRLAPLVAARRKSQPLASWSAILIKAIALTSQKWPELRRAYIAFPWPHLYEHPHSVATVVIEREWQGSWAVFADQIPAPETKSVRHIDHLLEGAKGLKVEVVGSFRRVIRITRYPLLVRRLLWLIALRGAGRLKSRYFGTFSINSLNSRHAQMTQSVTLNISFVYGPVAPDGKMPIQIFFDHRVIDGSAVCRLLIDLENTLNREIVDELTRDAC